MVGSLNTTVAVFQKLLWNATPILVWYNRSLLGHKRVRSYILEIINLLLDYWANEANRREFFIQFAKEKGLDPFSAASWYPVSYTELYKFKVSALIKFVVINISIIGSESGVILLQWQFKKSTN